MKIVQIAVSSDQENGEALYGLDDRGNLYVHVCHYAPRKDTQVLYARDGLSLDREKLPVCDPPLRLPEGWTSTTVSELARGWRYTAGHTAGWKLATAADAALAHPTYHPEDPEH
jgi:hypothetical protein